MSLVPLKHVLDHAAENNYGIPAFNVNNMEQIQAIMEAADTVCSPVILQASRGARKYADGYLMYLIKAAVKKYPHLPIVMHQDHGNSPATCHQAIVAGFTSVMMDGSLEADGKTPSSYQYNVDVTKPLVDFAHSVGVSVEGELGCLGSLETGKGEAEDGHGFEGELSKDMLLTDPDQAADFVKQTGVDALAIAIGTSHGAYKFSKPPTSDVLDLDRIKAIHEAVPNTHLVMHGASSVPWQYIDLINTNGGKISETYGVPIESIREGIDNGIRKINIDTDLRLAYTAAIYEAQITDPSNFDPRHFNSIARQYMRKVCLERYESFGCIGQALTIPTYGI